MLLTIGSDMELFAKHQTGEHVSLCGKIGGTKEKPLQLIGYPEGYMIQEDNVALEFNIPVCQGKTQFVNAFRTMREYIPTKLNKLDLVLSTNASVSFDKKELTHPNALVFGCEPDYDAWSMKENRKPSAKNECLRTAGGHIHVGSTVDMIGGVRKMDLLLGVPSILLDDNPASVARRELYGKAGAMRPKPYGWEYRVLSNYWMFTDDLVAWVYEQTDTACNSYNELTEKEGTIVQKCINEGNKSLAKELIDKYKIQLPKPYKEQKKSKIADMLSNSFNPTSFTINITPL